ncbi:CSC1-like protein At1g11960 isoform X3 [Physcomitrium patens]|uniref:CSC1-like protein At1g11960 isoform X3 n=1 Tax=Physcomitrium patens TaxID=3218 RepID=UPI003CCCE335
MASLYDIGVSAVINCTIMSLLFIFFLVFNIQPLNDRVYHPKLYMKDAQRKGSPSSRSSHPKMDQYFETKCLPYLQSFAWIVEAFRMSEHQIIDHAGLDAAIFLRNIQVGLKIFIPLMTVGLSTIVTINVGGGYLKSLDHGKVANINNTLNSSPTNSLLFTDIDKLSIANVPSGSSSARRQANQFTVLVHQVPKSTVESINIQVQKYFRANHPDFYLSHQLVYNANRLANIVKRRKNKENWLSYWHLRFKASNERPMTRRYGCGMCGTMVDAINLYTTKIEKLNKKAELERVAVLQDASSTMPSAFVSFKTRWGAAVCAQTQQSFDPTKWITAWAPEPRDIYWPNLAIPYIKLACRRVCVGICLFVLVFCFMIPITIVQSFASIQGLRTQFPQLEKVLKITYFASFVQGYLPGVILKFFMKLVPYMVRGLTIFEGHSSFSRLDQQGAMKYYYFMVVNVFFGSMLTGSALEQLQSFLNSSSVVQFLKTLAYTIPMKATFFITFIMVDGWAGAASEILRPWGLLSYHIQNAFFVHTEMDKVRAMDPGPIIYYVNLAQLQLYFLMGLVYSVITPIILPFVVVTFAINYVVYRHQVIHVYEAAYESAGSFWPFVHGRIIVALYIEQLMLIGLFLVQGPITFKTIHVSDDDSLKEKALKFCQQAMSSTPFVVALPIFTYIFHRYCKTRFEPCFLKFPLEHASKKDMDDRTRDPNFNMSEFIQNSYKHPDFLDERVLQEIRKETQLPTKIQTKPQKHKNEMLDNTVDIPNMEDDASFVQMKNMDVSLSIFENKSENLSTFDSRTTVSSNNASASTSLQIEELNSTIQNIVQEIYEPNEIIQPNTQPNEIIQSYQPIPRITRVLPNYEKPLKRKI